MRTSEAVTGAGGIPVGYATLALVYLGVACGVVLDPAPAGRAPLGARAAPRSTGGAG